jgi:hypothetical protein
MGFALDSGHYNQSNSAYKREVRLVVVLTSNGTTVSVDADRSASGFTITTGANGALTGTMPKSSRGILLTQGFDPAASTIALLANVTAFSPTAGTFGLQTHTDNTEAVIPSASELWLYFILEGG